MIRLPPRSTLFPNSTLFRSHPPLTIDDLALAYGFGPHARHHPRIIAVGNEADVLAVGLVRDGKRELARHLPHRDRKSTRLNSSHANISYAGFCLKKKHHKYS